MSDRDTPMPDPAPSETDPEPSRPPSPQPGQKRGGDDAEGRPAKTRKTNTDKDPDPKKRQLVHFPGARIKLEDQNSLINNLSATAGYLNFKDMDSFREWLDGTGTDSTAHDILEAWRRSRQNHFSVPGLKTNHSWSLGYLLPFLKDSKYQSLWAEDVSVPLGDTFKGLLPGLNYAYGSWIATMAALMHTYDEHFPDTLLKEEEGTYESTPFHAEDWNRAFWVLKAYWRYKSDARNKPKSRKKPQNRGAILPVFMTPEELAEVEGGSKLTAVDLDATTITYHPAEALFDEEVENVDEEDARALREHLGDSPPPEKIEEIREILLQEVESQVVGAVTEANEGSVIRPPLTADQQARTLVYQGDKAIIISDEFIDSGHSTDQLLFKAMTEETLAEVVDQTGDDESAVEAADKHEREAKQFWELHSKVSTISARPPSYLVACQKLGLDPARPEMINYRSDTPEKNRVVLKPWQVTGAAWMLKQERRSIQGGVIADDCGLGKTITTLTAIYMSSIVQERRVAQGEKPSYRPTLVIVPAHVVVVWDSEIRDYFSDQLLVFRAYENRDKTSDPLVKERILPHEPGEFMDWMVEHCPDDDVRSARTIILTTYQTWHARSLVYEVKRQDTDDEIGESNEETVNESGEPGANAEVIYDENGEPLTRENVLGQLDGPAEGRDDEETQAAKGGKEDENGEKGETGESDEDSRSSPTTEDPTEDERSDSSSDNDDPLLSDSEDEDDDDDDGDGDHDENQEKGARVGRGHKPLLVDKRYVYSSRFTGFFYRVVCDEGHKIKNPSTLTYVSVQKLEAEQYWILSATPMINREADLAGYLSLFWDDDWALTGKDAKMREAVYTDDFFPATTPYWTQAQAEVTAVNPDARVWPWWRLDPRRFARLLPKERKVDVAHLILPAILSILQLRRTMTTKIDNGDETDTKCIGDEIPHYRITTVELKMTQKQARLHALYYDSMKERLYRHQDPKAALAGRRFLPQAPVGTMVEGTRDFGVHRRLSHLSFDLSLERIARRQAKTLVPAIKKWYERSNDGGMSFLFQVCKPPEVSHWPHYADRISFAHWLGCESPKLQYLSRLLAEWCYGPERQRVLVYTGWPMTQWKLEGFLGNIGMRFDSLRSGMTSQDRAKVISRFNDPDSDIQVLSANLRTSALGVNLQRCCSKLVMLDLADNINLTLQTIGRIHRLGQKEVQEVYILTVDHTYDQVLQFKQTDKMLNQISGEAAIQLPEEFRSLTPNMTPPDPRDSDASAEYLRQVNEYQRVRAQMIGQQSAEVIRLVLGQRSSRADWGDHRNLRAKDERDETTDTPPRVQKRRVDRSQLGMKHTPSTISSYLSRASTAEAGPSTDVTRPSSRGSQFQHASSKVDILKKVAQDKKKADAEAEKQARAAERERRKKEREEELARRNAEQAAKKKEREEKKAAVQLQKEQEEAAKKAAFEVSQKAHDELLEKIQRKKAAKAERERVNPPGRKKVLGHNPPPVTGGAGPTALDGAEKDMFGKAMPRGPGQTPLQQEMGRVLWGPPGGEEVNEDEMERILKKRGEEMAQHVEFMKGGGEENESDEEDDGDEGMEASSKGGGGKGKGGKSVKRAPTSGPPRRSARHAK